MENGVLEKILTHSLIRRLAGERYYERGRDYFQQGQVSSLRQNGKNIRARVAGTHDYAVSLSAKAKTLAYQCDCPIGSDGECCKHCVAVAGKRTAWIGDSSSAEKSRSSGVCRRERQEVPRSGSRSAVCRR
jgi:uncharacterized Zn finger protein